MHALSNTVVGIALVAVTIVLFMGLANMLRGGSPNLSQKLMRWRVGLQFLAILIIMGVLFLRSWG
jgi:Hypoxia induced protein conserved region